MRLAALLSAMALASPVAAAASDAAAGAEVDAIMRPYTGAVPGASVLVLREGAVVLERAYGLADVEQGVAATPATNYRLASVTKQFTAAAILLLVQDGRLQLEDGIRKWLPSLPRAADAITLRHLLTHSSGLVDYEDVMAPGTTTQLRDADVLGLLEQQQQTYFFPGQGYRYSNSGYALLALVVERASGQDFAGFLQQRIFEPLGMAQSLAHVAGGPPVADRAYGHSAAGEGWIRTDQSPTSAVLGDGGVYSSIRDLARWDAALYDDRLLGDALRDLMFSGWVATDAPGVRYGFGWRVSGDSVWHSGETIGFRNVLIRYPRQRLTVVVLSNRDDPEPHALARRIAALYLPGQPEGPR